MRNELVTVFGGGGFLGRYVVRDLLAAGARVRIASRTPSDGWFLKTQAALGQMQFVAADIRSPDSVARALAGSWGAVNLVGVLTGDFEGLQRDGAGNVARAARDAGVAAFVHMSALGADAGSLARYGRTKAQGEALVHHAFPEAIVLRPSVVFGREDQFVNRFAAMIAALPIVPVLRGDAKFQPVFVGDVARAVVAALDRRTAGAGQVFALGGPAVFTMASLNRWIAAAIGRHPLFLALPDVVGVAMARGLGWAPGAPITHDQWLMLQNDNVVGDARDGLAELEIEPTPLEAVADNWLVRYRKHGRFTNLKD